MFKHAAITTEDWRGSAPCTAVRKPGSKVLNTEYLALVKRFINEICFEAAFWRFCSTSSVPSFTL